MFFDYARLVLFISALLAATFFSFSAHAEKEKRCGWIDNPTPGNWSLFDRAGEWVISTQGDGSNIDTPIITSKRHSDWVATQYNGYGFGCACMTVTADAGDRENLAIRKIHDVRQLPISRCSDDKNLPQEGWQRNAEIEETSRELGGIYEDDAKE